MSRQASFSAARTIHQDTANAAAVSETARPERMTASTSWSRSRPVERARRGTWAVDSKNESRSHAGSSQYQRYLDQSTSTAPATGMSRSPLEAAFLPPRRDDTAARAARWLVGFDDDLAPAIGEHGGGDDAVVGQVEEDGGSVGCDPGRLVQGSWSCSRLNARHTHPSRATGPFVFNDTNSIPHQPRRARKPLFTERGSGASDPRSPMTRFPRTPVGYGLEIPNPRSDIGPFWQTPARIWQGNPKPRLTYPGSTTDARRHK